MEKGHEVEGGVVMVMLEEPAVQGIHDHASQGAAAGNNAEGGAEDALREEIDDHRAEVSEPRGEAVGDDGADRENAADRSHARYERRERDEEGAHEHDAQTRGGSEEAALDEETGEEAAEKKTNIGGEKNGPHAAKAILVEAADGGEIFGHPELIEIPDGIGEEPGHEEEPDTRFAENFPPDGNFRNRCGSDGRRGRFRF